MTITIEKLKHADNGYTDLKWVISAVSAAGKNDVRYMLNGLHVENNKVIGTDGHRLHMADLTDKVTIPDGNYSFRTGKDFITLEPINPEDGNYPNWKRVIPDREKLQGETFELRSDTHKKFGGDTSHFRQKVIAHHMVKSEFKSTLNLSYLEDVNLPDTDWKVTIFDALSPVLFENCTKTAVIMPVRC